MKNIIKFLFLFLPILSMGQDHISFYVSSEHQIGAECLFKIKGTESFSLGGGFSGSAHKSIADGEFMPGHAGTKYATNTVRETWCSIYATSSFGYVGPVLIKYRTGLAVYEIKQNYNNNGDLYNKDLKEDYEPLVGVSVMYEPIKDIGIELGFDNYNKLTVGFCVIFK
jgi:hypothetical protein